MPANDGRSSGVRLAVLWVVLFGAVGSAVALFAMGLPEAREPLAATAQETELSIAPFGAAAADECLRLSANPTDYLSESAMQRRSAMRLAACREAQAAAPDDVHLQVALARALPHEQRPQALDMLRAAAAPGDGEANYEIYESHNSWDHHTDQPQLVTGAEAERALRAAAASDYPPAVYRLATLLGRGGLVKRDAVAERFWVERALRLSPPQYATHADMQIRLGSLLAGSNQPDERARGLDLLERLSSAGPFGAKAALAAAVRAGEPVRARALYEDAVRGRLGGVADLAQMLLNGEGGPAEPKRALALALLRDNRDTPSAKGVLGQIYLDGRLVSRDVPKAIDLLITAGVWDYDVRLQALQLLAAHPEIPIGSADIVRYEAAQAAERGEPGALAAWLALKLSSHPQFQDRPGACKLLATAALRGDPAAAQRLADCPAP